VHLMITWTACAGTSLSSRPCHVRHGYMITSAHRVEEGVDRHVSAPPSGAAAASPAGAVVPESRGKDWHDKPTCVVARVGGAGSAHNDRADFKVLHGHWWRKSEATGIIFITHCLNIVGEIVVVVLLFASLNNFETRSGVRRSHGR
jgi:hypothetical protein